MAVTLTEQWSVLPVATSGPTGTEYLLDSEGMHSFIPYDLVRQLNNMGSYCMNWAQFSMPPGSSSQLVTPGEATGEHFIGQMPVTVPMGATRMLWTAAIFGSTAGGGISVNSLKCYLSIAPYAGLRLPFASTSLDPNTRSSTITQTTSTAVYSLYADGVTGITPLDLLSSPVTSSTGQARIAYAILTANHTGATGGGWYMRDFTVWFHYE